MTIGEFLQLPAGVIAATATLLAGLVAATTVILSSVINARTARIVARDAFRRQILYDSAKPFLERLNSQVAAYERYIEAGPLVAAQLRGISKTPPDAAKAKTEAVATSLSNLAAELRATKELWNSTSGMSVIARDQKLVDAAARWARATSDFLNLHEGNTFGITAEPGKLAEMRKAARVAMWKAVGLRIEIEEVVIQPRGWVSSQVYRVTRRFRKSGDQ